MAVVFEISVLERVIESGHFNNKYSCEALDGVGLFILYDEGEKPTAERVRSFMPAVQGKKGFVEANSPAEAISIFFNGWEGALVGGDKSEESKARWINRSNPIMQLPDCLRRHKNREREYICGELEEGTGQGEWGRCCLEGDDSPDDCPMNDFYEEASMLQALDKTRITEVEVGGLKYPVYV